MLFRVLTLTLVLLLVGAAGAAAVDLRPGGGGGGGGKHGGGGGSHHCCVVTLPPGPDVTVAGLGQFTLDGNIDAAVGLPLSHHEAGQVTVYVDAMPVGRTQPSAVHGSPIVITGERPGDQLGYAIAGGYDVTGAAFPDLIIGAPNASPDGRREAGAVWIIFGTPAPGVISLTKLRPDQGYEIVGSTAGDHLGAAVASVRNISGNGHYDIVLGAPGANGGAGAAYVVYNQIRSGTLDLAHLDPTRGYSISGAPAGSRLGASVSGAGYMNGDAYAEVIVGAPGGQSSNGAAYVVYGRTIGAGNVRLGTPGTGFKIVGDSPYDNAGAAVAAVGSVRHNGITDVAVGAPDAFVHGRNRPGTACVVFGGNRGGVVSLRNLGRRGQGYCFSGHTDGDRFGAALAGTDGTTTNRGRLFIGAPSASVGGRGHAGVVYVVNNPPSQATSAYNTLPGGAGYQVAGADPNDATGASVADLIGTSDGVVVGVGHARRRTPDAYLVPGSGS
jgi:glycosylphosphatidylinositol phospholipase D